ncbi:MAG: alpha/beta hydrolase fold protein [Acidimicrobiales bacterium]|nr:alpha/beta hydrolase fold protein [Acidimicrobiales bacterium]
MVVAGPGDAPPEGIRQFVTIHGYRRAYVRSGSGPAVLLLHGIGDNSDSWRDLIPELARDHTVIAPDLLGHGRSDKPRADYSVAAYANGMRDLLDVLDVDRVTIVGHSLGGGVAAQFAYQFPNRCERLVLVGSGGVGRTVSPIMRLVASPLADVVLPVLGLPFTSLVGSVAVEVLRRSGHPLGRDADDVHRVLGALPDGDSRRAFVRTLRSVVDTRGQVVTMLDRCYLAKAMPTLLVWGAHDGMIPIEHAHLAHAAMPGSRLEIFEDAAHFPHHNDPERFLAVLRSFMAETTPNVHELRTWRAMLKRGRPAADVIPMAMADAGDLAEPDRSGS